MTNNQMTLTETVDEINQRGLRLIQKLGAIRIEGDCPPELAEAIHKHRSVLMGIASLEPEEAKEIVRLKAEQVADAFCQSIGQSVLNDATLQSVITEGLKTIRESRSIREAEAEAAALRDRLDGVQWAGSAFE